MEPREPGLDREVDALLGAIRRDMAEGDDAAVQRVSRRLHTAPARTGRRLVVPLWGAGAAMAATAALLLLVLRLSAGPPAPETPAQVPPTLAEGMDLVATSAVRAGGLAGGAVQLTLGPGSALLRLPDAAGGVPVLDLERGVVAVDVTPGAVPGLRLLAGPVQVEVLGTSFVVTREGDEVTVSVARGRVLLTHGDLERQLSAGQAWGTATTLEPSLSPPSEVSTDPYPDPPTPGSGPP